MSKPARNSSGFSLVELLVVISIIAILASIAVITINSILKQTRDIRRKADLRTIQIAIDSYYYQTGKFPGPGNCNVNNPSWINWSTCKNNDWDDDSDDVVGILQDGGYITKMRKDPLNKGGPKDPPDNSENYTYGYRAWPEGEDATYYLCANLETQMGNIQYGGYNYCVRGGCTTCH